MAVSETLEGFAKYTEQLFFAALLLMGLAFVASFVIVVLDFPALSFGVIWFEALIARPVLLMNGQMVACYGGVGLAMVARVCKYVVEKASVFKYAVVRARWPPISFAG